MRNIVSTLRRLTSSRKWGRVLPTILVMVVMIASLVLQNAASYESKAYANENDSLDGNTVEEMDAIWAQKVADLNLEGKGTAKEVHKVAVSQLDYKAMEFRLEDGGSQYYSFYGNQYGMPYEDWNTAFVSYCLEQATVDARLIPSKKNAENWKTELQEKGLFVEGKVEPPVSGNVVFFYSANGEENLSVGVVDAEDETGVQVIVGDYDHKVQKISVDRNMLLGYARIPVEEIEIKEKTPAAMLKENPRGMGEAEDSNSKGPVTTVDTKAYDVKLNMFDYSDGNASTGVSNDELDNGGNVVNSVVRKGINVDGNRRRSLVFLGMGTHQNDGTVPNDSREYQDPNLYQDPNFMNVYTGENNSARQGIVIPKLGTDGYPILSATTPNAGGDASLAYLFDPNTGNEVGGKTIYADLNYLFKKDANGYFEFDSDKDYAYLPPGNSSFNLTSYDNNKSIGFFPFNKYNSKNTNVGPGQGYNHHFGLTMELEFYLNQDNKINGNDMVFEFSGDDDVWVFIDDVLVLDLGGIHGKVDGSINFRSGEVKVSAAERFDNNTEVKTDIVTQIKDAFTTAGDKYDDSAWSHHTLKFFYLERGGYESNCKIRYNLVSQLQISKDIVATNKEEFKDDKFRFKVYVQDNVNKNSYSVLNQEMINSKGLKVFYSHSNQNVGFDKNGIFILKDGWTLNIEGLNSNLKYKVEELGVDDSIYPEVKIGDKTYTKEDNEQTFNVVSTAEEIKNRKSIVFKNILKEKYKDITVKKVWKDANGTSTESNLPEKIEVKLHRTYKDKSGTHDEVVETLQLKGDNWEAKANNLPTLLGNRIYSYYVKEVTEVPGYISEGSVMSTDDNGNITFTITNKAFDITVVKEWMKPDGVTPMTTGIPNKIEVVILRSTSKPAEGSSGAPKGSKEVARITLSPANKWTHTSSNIHLEANDANGNPYYYFVKELDLGKDADSYIVSYDNNNGITSIDTNRTITITNTYKYVDNTTLPTSGGRGTTMFTITGIVLLLLPCLMYIVLRVRKGGACR